MSGEAEDSEGLPTIPDDRELSGHQKAVSLPSLHNVPSPRLPHRRKALSDAATFFLQSENARHHEQKVSSSDIIRLFNDPGTLFGQADLRMAEVIQEKGTISDRLENEKELVIKGRDGYALPDGFVLNKVGLSSYEAETLLKKYGTNELFEKIASKWLTFLKQFWAPMPIMIWIAIIIEIAIANYIDMTILLIIQFANASISFYESTKAANAVAALKSKLKPMATAKRDGNWISIDACLLVPGDLVLLSSGSGVPADCRLNKGEIDVDQASLTGESLPVTFYHGDSCKMGSTIVRGETEATVEFTGVNTFFGKTASLLTDKHKRSNLQKVLISIMAILVAIAIVLCLVNFLYLLLNTKDLKTSLSFTIVLLVASIPLAIEIVTTTTLAIGSKTLATHGAIVAKLSAIEQLAGMSILCSDKTGTLTINQMVLQNDTPTFIDGQSQESVLVLAALAAKWQEPPRDALDRLVLESVDMSLLQRYKQLEYEPFNSVSKRTEATIRDEQSGEVFKVSKGAPNILLKLLPSSDDEQVINAVESHVGRLGSRGIRSLAVVQTDSKCETWHMVGLLTFLDPPREDTKQTIQDASRYGVSVKMITGDHQLIAKNTANALEMGDNIFTAERLPILDTETKKKPDNLSEEYGQLCLEADGFAGVFPEHKYLIVECLREMGYIVGMTGDGVNDAPALKIADIGIAVSGACDAARAAGDIVLTQPGLSTIIHAILVARQIFARINNFITYRIAATLQLVCFFFIATFAFHPNEFTPHPEDEEDDRAWPEFFHTPVLMLMLITLLNDGTLITIGYDNAKASTVPCKWNLPRTFIISTTLGSVSFASSLLLLWLLLDSNDPHSMWQKLFGLEGIRYGELSSAIYLKVSISDFLTMFSARTGERPFFSIKPATILLFGGLLALALSSILSIFWPDSYPDDIPVLGLRYNMGVFVFVWIFCLFFWIIQDSFKVFVYNLFGIAATTVEEEETAVPGGMSCSNSEGLDV